jgi:phosphoribosylaminoimidazole carboxylase (NCAIR synthetase)
MLALAGYPLRIQCRVLDPSPDARAGQVAEHVAVAFDSEPAVERFSHGLQVATFECALPIGSTASAGHAAMINVIGASPEPASILAFEGAHLHLYGKAPRPGRKLGHVTVVRQDEAELSEAVGRLRGLVESVSA